MAAWSDWKYYRIPNRLIIFGIVSGIMSLDFQAADLEAGSKIPWLLLALSGFLVRGVAVLVLGIFLHSLGMIGAADLKLVALLAAWLGFSETIKILCVGFILGAVWSLQKMLRYGSAFQRFLYLSAYIRQILSNKKIEKYYDPVRDGTECVIPLGTCFCMATVLVFLEKWIF